MKTTFTRKVRVSWGRHVPVQHQEGVIELTIDIDALAQQLAYKAFSSKGKQSRLASGRIIAKAHSIEEIKS